ncbi:relaxase/mobilization nuclease domain-containing protein [Candidatus Magnetaquicoccus inordinatus]|uniref:relaxase/mobilization nuclease domain-containing protein n=1 Tax=Candidatus Magnetaquicoccus inordinatus TaxID=2496818 RepID=UPI00102CF67C|nr:relaxase/mobilization nuclease domain-containing protein [Candidatus Magnetaquicoccus inordinatus]
MITKGNTSTGCGLAAYLNKDANDRVEVWDIRGAAINDLAEAIDDWREFSKGTNCEKPLYHAQLNPDRALRREEWGKAIEIFEKEMGLEGYPRAVVLHEKKGREHVHLVYSRIDLETMRAWSDSWNYLKHERASREIEREFGLDKTQGVHVEREDSPRPGRTPSHKDMQQGDRKGQDAREVTAEVSALFAQANGAGAAFVKGLEGAGYTLARGDQRVYVVVDRQGGVHSLSRRAQVKAATLREMLRDAPLEKLPSVKEAQAQQKAHAKERTGTDSGNVHKAAMTEAKSTEPTREPPTKAADPSPSSLSPRGGGLRGAGAIVREGLQVGGVAGGATKSLMKAVDGLLDFFMGTPAPKVTAYDRLTDPKLRRQEMRAQECRDQAIDNMRDAIAEGRNLNADDLQQLSREDLLNLRARGDAYLYGVIEEREERRQRQKDSGREREW